MRIDNAGSGASRDPNVRNDLERLREVTGKVVGSVFYGTMLKAMRTSKLKGTYGHGGRGEEVFSAQLHQVLAERMGTQTKHGLVDAMYKHMGKQQMRISNQVALPGDEPR